MNFEKGKDGKGAGMYKGLKGVVNEADSHRHVLSVY